MGKKNSTFGKLLAFTTTAAAIGGACYIFRDQIKESSIYKKASDKFSGLRNKMSDKFSNNEDDFFFDDDFEDDFEDDVFSDDAKNNREYTSITINPKEEETSVTDVAKEMKEDISNAVEDLKESSDKKDETTPEEFSGYENEGLSDVDEDPDVLSDMDKLDF